MCYSTLMKNTHCVHLIISGRVHGVGFRAFTVGVAKRLGVDGWVRNRRDGTVEIVVSGSQQTVDEMLGELHKGPLAARVDAVTINAYHEKIQQGFNRLETA